MGRLARRMLSSSPGWGARRMLRLDCRDGHTQRRHTTVLRTILYFVCIWVKISNTGQTQPRTFALITVFPLASVLSAAEVREADGTPDLQRHYSIALPANHRAPPAGRYGVSAGCQWCIWCLWCFCIWYIRLNEKPLLDRAQPAPQAQ